MLEPLILTYTGRYINPLNVKIEDICLEDVAHHLALINRFTGATKGPMNVAQHVVAVSKLLEGTGLEKQGLHHDDAEYAVSDVSKWFKESPEMTPFREAEARAQCACYTAFGIKPEDYIQYPHMMHPLVLEADRLMLRFEGVRGFGIKMWNKWLEMMNNPLYPSLSEEEYERVNAISPKTLTWRQSKQAYLARHKELEARR